MSEIVTVSLKLPAELVAKIDETSGEGNRSAFIRAAVERGLKSGVVAKRPRRIAGGEYELSGDLKIVFEAVKAAKHGLTAREAGKLLDWPTARVASAEHQLQDLRMIDYPDGQGVMRATEVEE
jgi:Arc/MetJ-type ribon-helix-helix transcriptional regulator